MVFTRARSRSSGATMSEGPLALVSGGISPSGDTLGLLPILQRTDPLVETEQLVGVAASGVARASGAAMPSGSFRCPLRSSGRAAPSMSDQGPPSPRPRYGGRSRADSFSDLVARALGNNDNFDDDAVGIPGGYHPRGSHALNGSTHVTSGVSSPASLPDLERVDGNALGEGELTASLSSSEDISSLGDAAVSGLGEDDDAAEEEPSRSEPEPAVPFAAAASVRSSTRRSRRAAAQRATARVSAALHSNGMADLDAFSVEAVAAATSRGRGEGGTPPWSMGSTIAASRTGMPAARAAEDDDDDSVAVMAGVPHGGVAGGRARRCAGTTAGGPKTTGESPELVPPSEPATMVLRRSARKRSVAALKDDGSEEEKQSFERIKSETKAGPKSTGEDEADVKMEKPEPAAKCEVESCCICLDVPDRYELSTVNGCEHLYCFSCIEKWADRENTCPQCKKRFTKIERVHRPPPAKRRKRGDLASSEGNARPKNSKKVKNRDQRADMAHGNPLQGLFATMEANGTMPHSIAQLIFSGLGGINGGLMGGSIRSSGGHGSSVSRASHRHGARTSRGGMPDETFPLQPVPTPLTAMVRRLSSAARHHHGPTGAFAASSASVSTSRASAPPRGTPIVHLPDPWSLSVAATAGGGTSPSSSSSAAPPPRMSYSRMPRAHLSSSRSSPPAVAHPFTSRRDSSSSSASDGGDGLDADFPDFVRRVQQRSADRYAIGRSGSSVGSFAHSTFGAVVGETASTGLPSGRAGATAETALEIDSDDDNDVIEVIEVGED